MSTAFIEKLKIILIIRRSLRDFVMSVFYVCFSGLPFPADCKSTSLICGKFSGLNFVC